MFNSFWKNVIIFILIVTLIGGTFFVISSIQSFGQPIVHPIVLANLSNTTLQFLCLGYSYPCYNPIDVGSYINIRPDSVKQIFLDSIYFNNASSIFVIIGPADYASLLNINPSTKQVNSTSLPQGIDQRLILYNSGRMIIGTNQGEINIYQSDLSVKKIRLKLSENGFIGHLIQRNNNEIIAINLSPIIKDGFNYNEVFIVNINNGIIAQKLLQGPVVNETGLGDTPVPGKKIAVVFDNIDEDLNNLYYFSVLGKLTGGGSYILSKYNLGQMADIASTNIDECVDWNSGYSQYHHILFSSRKFLEGSTSADMFDMDNLHSLLNTGIILNNSRFTRVIIAPQGEDFVVGTNDTVYVISIKGQILKQYPIQLDWTKFDYLIMEDRN